MAKSHNQIVVAVVHNRTDVLVSQRRAEQKMAFYWEFPGGKVTTNESLEQALERELLEETGLQLKSQSKLYSFDYADATVHFFSVALWDGTLDNPEGQVWRWHKIAHLNQLSFPKANEQVLQWLLNI